MFEIKWVMPEGTTTLAPRLLYRHMQPSTDASGALCPGEWTDWVPVPTELVSDDQFDAARTPYLRPNSELTRDDARSAEDSRGVPGYDRFGRRGGGDDNAL